MVLPAPLLVSGVVMAHLLWSTEVFQPRLASRMYMCLNLRYSYIDWGGQVEGSGFQPLSQLCTSSPACAAKYPCLDGYSDALMIAEDHLCTEEREHLAALHYQHTLSLSSATATHDYQLL